MISKKIKIKIFTVILLLTPFLSVLAQDDEFEDDVQDLPGAPIDDYVILAIFIAIALAYVILKKQRHSFN